MPPEISLLLRLLLALFLLIGLPWLLRRSFLDLWVRAMASNASVSLKEIISMKLRRIDAKLVVMSRIRLVKAGIKVSVDQLVQHHVAGGHLSEVTSALIGSRAARLDLTWEAITARDLAGHDVLAEVYAAAGEKDAAKFES